jgi:hypothetical protein
MYTLLIIFIIMIVVSFICVFDSEENIPGRFFFSLISGGFLTIFCATIVLLVSSFLPSGELVNEYSLPLYSGFNDTRIEGHFYLLSGRVDEVDKVFYWYKDSGGAISKYEAPMYSSKFYEENRQDATMIVKKYGCKDNNRWYICPDIYEKYEFHIPHGSIYTGYNFK